MSTKRPTVHLVLEIHCRVSESVATALRAFGREPAGDTAGYASVWIAPPEEQASQPSDTLEQSGMVRVYGPAPIHDAEIYREKLGFVLSRSGCEIQHDTVADD